MHRHPTLNPDWAPSNLLFLPSYHPTHFQIYFHSLPSWLPPINADDENAIYPSRCPLTADQMAIRWFDLEDEDSET